MPLIVTVHGQPVADLSPHQVEGAPKRTFVPAREFDEALAQLPPVDAEQWRRDVADADAVFGDDRPTDPWDAVHGS